MRGSFQSNGPFKSHRSLFKLQINLSKKNSDRETFSEKFWKRQESNPGLLGVKHKSYLWAKLDRFKKILRVIHSSCKTWEQVMGWKNQQRVSINDGFGTGFWISNWKELPWVDQQEQVQLSWNEGQTCQIKMATFRFFQRY